jgi:hypothetical protein
MSNLQHPVWDPHDPIIISIWWSSHRLAYIWVCLTLHVMMYVIVCLPFQHLLDNFCFFIYFSLAIKMKNSSNSYGWWGEKKDVSKIFVSFSFRACNSNKDIHKVWFHGVNALYHWKHGPQLRIWCKNET